MDVLQIPLGSDKFRGKPVEQFRMSRLVPSEPEIVCGSNEAFAEMIQPKPIHYDASRERISGPGDPVSQLCS